MLKIVTVPAEILSSPTKQVGVIDERIRKLVKEMEKTLAVQNDPMGVGLAANQVGIDLSLFIIKPSQKAKIKVFINPKIMAIKTLDSGNWKLDEETGNLKLENLPAGKGQTSNIKLPNQTSSLKHQTSKKHTRIKLEGCLSIPRIWGPVKRAERVFLHYQDVDGIEHHKWFSGFEAMIIQHEVDHLKGITFTQRSLEQKGQLYREENDELVKIEY
jgi:peptide deformylase